MLNRVIQLQEQSLTMDGKKKVVGKFNRNFIRATMKAAFLFFLSLPFSFKRALESVAYFLEKPLVKS